MDYFSLNKVFPQIKLLVENFIGLDSKKVHRVISQAYLSLNTQNDCEKVRNIPICTIITLQLSQINKTYLENFKRFLMRNN